ARLRRAGRLGRRLRTRLARDRVRRRRAHHRPRSGGRGRRRRSFPVPGDAPVPGAHGGLRARAAMTQVARAPSRSIAGLAPALDRRFEAVVFDWDGTAVPDRHAGAARLRRLVRELCSRGLDLAVITGTHVGNIDEQLQVRPARPGRLYLCGNRGWVVVQADEDGRHLLYRLELAAAEEAALGAAGAATVAGVGAAGWAAGGVGEGL